MKIGWHHIGSLKPVMVGIFIPQKLECATNQEFCSTSLRKLVVKYLPAHYYFLLSLPMDSSLKMSRPIEHCQRIYLDR
jgi:hypothetical protein